MGPGVRGGPPGRWPADIPASAHLFIGLADTIDLDGEDGHHLARVLRLRAGETVTAADGAGAWRPYRIVDVHGAGVRLEATGTTERQPTLTPRLAVAFALTKGEKPEFVVQKLTELGVDRILPVIADRSIARPDAERATKAHERWERIALEAARQCRRATLPTIEPVQPVTGLAGHPGLVVAERGGDPATTVTAPPGGEVLALVGPEGGLAPEEVEILHPWGRLGLGPLILRAETAAVAVATAFAVLRRPT
jgi:16S rRNA (uracil1498-N3)-methyltransferase